ncbi:hypothetical protein AMAG_11453 [Allomyces macrogynus ATCC 38327]|uniref:Uncharacterized protein n=1 Tax=Allomyces macrogynus (strain ATCC 38327) TaxID=578462 RepID=A0A0L0SWW0_ALLM3|nr:hypothetical protein AMAG_11453 [Allomyces macrogynus ATCC 38327]|eukprot:KNE66982.1 hypothetical protein AMAG_11453 [Allomyces macrogynus ATCC 38327]
MSAEAAFLQLTSSFSPELQSLPSSCVYNKLQPPSTMMSTKGSTAAASSAPYSTLVTMIPAATCPMPAPATAIKEDLANVPEYKAIPVLDVGIALDAPATAFTEQGPRGDALRALAMHMRRGVTQGGFFRRKKRGGDKKKR